VFSLSSILLPDPAPQLVGADSAYLLFPVGAAVVMSRMWCSS
jgi:hypothetical protein